MGTKTANKLESLTDSRWISTDDFDALQDELDEAWESFVIFGYVMRLPRVQTIFAA